jgi:hypothetical protein
MKVDLSAVWAIFDLIISIARRVALLGFSIVLLVVVSSMLGYNVPYFNVRGSGTELAYMVAALAFALRG